MSRPCKQRPLLESKFLVPVFEQATVVASQATLRAEREIVQEVSSLRSVSYPKSAREAVQPPPPGFQMGKPRSYQGPQQGQGYSR